MGNERIIIKMCFCLVIQQATTIFAVVFQSRLPTTSLSSGSMISAEVGENNKK